MKPRPPALDIARARCGPEMTRIGAPTMKGEVTQGQTMRSPWRLCIFRITFIFQEYLFRGSRVRPVLNAYGKG
jgi:hypothetical protein